MASLLLRVPIVVVSALALLASSACGAAPQPPSADSEPRATASAVREPPPSAQATNVVPAPPSPVGPPTFESLDVDGYLPAVVVAPPDDGRVRPLLVATHGAGGTPEAHCARWLSLVGARAFLLCTRGRVADRFLPPEERGYFYDGHIELGKEVVLAVKAIELGYRGRVDVERAVFAGYSQGASMGALFLHQRRENAAMFGRVILVEGGANEWTVALAERLHEAGIARIGLFCGQPRCSEAAARSTRWMVRAGIDAKVFYSAGAGHTYGGAVGAQVEAALPWLFSEDDRWLPSFD